MMRLQVAVIWRRQPHMDRAFGVAQSWWRRNGVGTHLVDAPTPEWNTAAARNQAMREYGIAGQPLVIADADTHPVHLSSLLSCVRQAERDSQAVHLPYTEYIVRKLLEPSGGREVARFTWSVSGILVATPEAWWGIGGQDERFVGWAPEDFAFSLAHRSLLGRDMPRTTGQVAAYQHPPNAGKTNSNQPHELWERYRGAAAAGRSEMVSLINEGLPPTRGPLK